MISKELLEILVCPENHQPLEPADAELLDRLNRAIGARRVRNKCGQLVESRITAGLVRQDRAVLYAIADDIPIMLIDESIPLDQLED